MRCAMRILLTRGMGSIGNQIAKCFSWTAAVRVVDNLRTGIRCNSVVTDVECIVDSSIERYRPDYGRAPVSAIIVSGARHDMSAHLRVKFWRPPRSDSTRTFQQIGRRHRRASAQGNFPDRGACLHHRRRLFCARSTSKRAIRCVEPVPLAEFLH